MVIKEKKNDRCSFNPYKTCKINFLRIMKQSELESASRFYCDYKRLLMTTDIMFYLLHKKFFYRSDFVIYLYKIKPLL